MFQSAITYGVLVGISVFVIKMRMQSGLKGLWHLCIMWTMNLETALPLPAHEANTGQTGLQLDILTCTVFNPKVVFFMSLRFHEVAS